jgi:hypothetical protein
MGERRSEYRGFVGKPAGQRLLGRPSVHKRIILKWIIGK